MRHNIFGHSTSGLGLHLNIPGFGSVEPSVRSRLRGGVIREDLHSHLREESIYSRPGPFKKLMDGDRATTRDWELLKLMVSLRLVRAA